MHSRDGELGAVCHVANAVYTSSNCAASCAMKEEGATVAITMNVTTHKYADPCELWWRQFSPDGTIHPPARSSDADQMGICQFPPPREGRDDTKSGGTTAPQVNAEPSRQNEDWRQSAAADAPNTVYRSPASNAATNTSERKPEFAFVRNGNNVPECIQQEAFLFCQRSENSFWRRMNPRSFLSLTASEHTLLGMLQKRNEWIKRHSTQNPELRDSPRSVPGAAGVYTTALPCSTMRR
ncbi:hypothetical protein MOQ_005420 [Trypanosoma cruzi marinkellei]|uniref:Uncharacterized protein n=1 Tax=Trypanosoma cruzi marinkellei TaxID=85056 RepID=K2MY81_TRYCR|nr:hypothetical protein MOQ_005420 [Trypanosoma cruzi marinkellei]